MLDARTTIRNFRDLQFDLSCLLNGIYALENGSSVVELKWSDGSVDKIPSYELIRDYVQSAFNTLGIGNNVIHYDNNLVVDGKLATKIQSIINTTLTFRNCHIGNIQADIVKLGNLVNISDIEHSGTIDTTVTTIKNSAVMDKIHSATLSVDTLNGSDSVSYVGREHLGNISGFPDTYLTAWATGVFKSQMVLDGYIKTYRDTDPHQGYEKLYIYAPYVYEGVATELRTGIYDIADNEYAKDSEVNISLLYPSKYFGHVTSTYASLTYNIPRDTDQYKVIRVYNVTQNSLRACNVWSFCQNRQNTMRIVPANYVSIPPYSAIDFIFTFTYTNDTLYAYMLPTKALL